MSALMWVSAVFTGIGIAAVLVVFDIWLDSRRAKKFAKRVAAEETRR